MDQNNQQTDDWLAMLSLDRADAANSLNASMVVEGAKLIKNQIRDDINCRLVVIYGQGKHFCAGADLNWMKESSGKSKQQNIDDAVELQNLYEAIVDIAVPTMALVRGAAYGGGVGLIAACDVALCQEDARICLSEVNIGIIPSVILPYLGRKMKAGALSLYGISGMMFSGSDAGEAGLVDVVLAEDDFDSHVSKWINKFLAASGDAQKRFKKLNKNLKDHNYQQSIITADFIAEARSSEDGKEGIGSFLEKRKPAFIRKLDKDFEL